MQWLPRERGAHVRGDRAPRPACCVERFGVDGIRLTGGEPTVRAHLPVLVAKLAALRRRRAAPATWRSPPTAPRSGLLADELRAAGLRRVNISLDSLRPGPVRRDDPARRARTACSTASTPRRRPASPRSRSTPSCSAASTTTRSSTSPTFGRDRGVEVRFIEFMPLDAAGDWRHRAGRQPGRDRRRHRRRATRSSRCRPAARRRPTAGATSTGAARSA